VSDGAGAAVTGRLAELAGTMREGGVRVGLGELLAAHRALAAVDPSSRSDSYFALRPALCSRRSDIDVFDAAFVRCFGGPVPATRMPAELEEAAKLALPRAAVPGASGTGEPASVDRPPVPAAWSDVEILRHKDFAHYTERERQLVRRLMARLALRGPTRRSRRLRAARARGNHRPDLRRTIRASLRYGGEPVERRWREHTFKPRPLVLVCDVSGSMQPYARMLLQYLHACVAARRRVEAFVFGTRLTRVTRELGGRDHDAALARATQAAADLSSGTRIGSALAELNREQGRRIGRGSVVVLVSDGWDRGDPDELAAEMARLRRCAHKLVWLNPLKASPDYEPLTRGMQAALPHVDEFLAGNSLASLEELAELLEGGI
jgi:uncharacterized protein with von Willebrand factor type A (vWA) domain